MVRARATKATNLGEGTADSQAHGCPDIGWTGQ